MSERDIFLAVFDMPDPAARSAYLDDVCRGDTALRARIEALLRSHETADSFLGTPVVATSEEGHHATRTLAPTPARESDAVRTQGGITATDTDDALAFLAPPSRPDSLGRIGHYEVLEVLGRGGFGIVFRAFDEVLQRVVAVKVLAPSMAVTSPARKRFLREARSSASVRHENVVHVYAVEEQPLPYLVMEFIPGETLQQRLDRTGPLDVPEILRIGRQIALGLAAAHENGLIHRDIKPSNILIDNGPQERVKITDFGLARAADDASISQSGVVAGTPMYMAPEQAKGDALDHRADLFSLGSVLYVMSTGRPPFRASGTLAVLKRVCEEDPRPIREVIPEVPEWLCRIIEKLLTKDPAERFQSAKEVADLLEQHLAHMQQPALVPMPEPVAVPSEESRAATVPFRPARIALRSSIVLIVAIAILLLWAPGKPWVIGSIVGLLFCLYLWIVLWARFDERALNDGQGRSVAPLRRTRRRWKWAAVPLAFAVISLVAWFGHAAKLYLSSRGELELQPQHGLVSVIVLQNDEGVRDENKLHPAVTDWLSMKSSHTLKLPPGKYQLNAGAADIHIDHWKVTTSGPFGSDTRLVPGEGLMGWSVIVTVERGCRVSVRPMMSAHNPFPPAATPPNPSTPPNHDGFVQLFNGKDVPGTLTARPNSWQVNNQLLVGTGENAGLMLRKNLQDFHCRIEAKVVVPGMANVDFRATWSPAMTSGQAVLESRIMKNRTGGLALFMQPKAGQLLAASPKPPSSPDGWFTIEIIAQGKKATIKVNGTTTAERTIPELPDRGDLVLSIVDKGTVIEFRKIEIKELPSSEPKSMVIKAFTEADKPLNYRFPNAGTITAENGGWKIVSGSNGTTPLFSAGTPNLRAGTLTFRAKMKSANLPKNAYLRMDAMLGSELVVFPVSRPITGVTDWAVYESSYVMDDNHIPDGVTLNVAFDSRGTVWIKDVELLYQPAPGVVLPPAKPADAWVPLFNGKDLTGWKTRPELPGIWRVEEGTLVGRYDGNGYLFSERGDYQNFHLRAEVKIGDKSNGGLLFRCESAFSVDLGKEAGPYPLGYEVDIVHTPSQEARTGSLWRDGKPARLLKSSPVRPDTWFALDVIAQGNHILVKIDGKEVASYLDPQKSSLPRGHIGLQVTWPETSVIQFRKIEIKELPASKPAVAPKPVLIKAFDPAKDKAVSLRGNTKEIVSVENGAWRIENAFPESESGNFRVALGTITEGIPEDGVLICRAKVKLQPKHKDTWGDLELGISSPSSVGYDWPRHLAEYRGEITEWTEKEVRYPVEVFRKKTPPTITIHAGLHGNGVLWVKDLELLHLPAPPKPAEPPLPSAPAPRPRQ